MRRDLVLTLGAAMTFAGLVACSKTSEPTPSAEGTAASAAPLASANPHAGMPGVAFGDGGPGAGPHGGMGAMPGMPGMPAMGGAPATGPDIVWDVPSAWTTAPNPNPMRKATYKIPKAAGDADDAELAVSSAAGGVEANVDRWAKQFGDAKAKTEPRTVSGLKVTMVEIKGTYAGGGMMGAGAGTAPKDKQMLLGAIVEQGERQHFFKMVGPEKTVTAAKKDFDKLVSSLHEK